MLAEIEPKRKEPVRVFSKLGKVRIVRRSIDTRKDASKIIEAGRDLQTLMLQHPVASPATKVIKLSPLSKRGF